MKCAIGLDFGTTTSSVAVRSKGVTKYVDNDIGSFKTASVVYLEPGKEPIVGVDAMFRRLEQPKRTIYDIKRFLGVDYGDAQLSGQDWTFDVVSGSDGGACVRVDDKDYTPQQIAALILGYMKQITRKYAKDVVSTVIAVPSHFNSRQRQATRDAAELAGFEVLQIVNESTAAAITKCHEDPSEEFRRFLVYDLGGGTFNVSIVEAEGTNITVVASDGIPFLGGIDVDRMLYQEAAKRFKQIDKSFSVAKNDWRLMESCEVAKKAISKMDILTVRYIKDDGEELSCEIASSFFDKMCEDLVKQTITVVERMIKDSDYTKDELDFVYKVGGASGLKEVTRQLRACFPGMRIDAAVDRDLTVVKGAAILAYGLVCPQDDPSTANLQLQLQDVTAHSLGVALAGGDVSVLIPKGTPLPVECAETFANADDNDQFLALEIMEGESDRAENNVRIARLRIKVDPKARNDHRIEVRFSINSSGILEVTAVEKNTLKMVSVIVQSNALTDEERQRTLEEQQLIARAAR